MIDSNYEPSLKASRIRAYVDPILKLFIDNVIIEDLETRYDRIENSIISVIITARKISFRGKKKWAQTRAEARKREKTRFTKIYKIRTGWA